MDNESSRIESEANVSAYLAKLRYALENNAALDFQQERRVDEARDIQYTNRYTVAELFPDEDPQEVLREELRTLKTKDYLRTVKDLRFPKRSDMWEFGKVYRRSDESTEVYIKIRVELLDARLSGNHTVFVMSFHRAEKPFEREHFPYCLT